MPTWYDSDFHWFSSYNPQANNPYYGKKKARGNHDQKQKAFKLRVEKRRAKKRNK